LTDTGFVAADFWRSFAAFSHDKTRSSKKYKVLNDLDISNNCAGHQIFKRTNTKSIRTESAR
jgi:hypothetical protein